MNRGGSRYPQEDDNDYPYDSGTNQQDDNQQDDNQQYDDQQYDNGQDDNQQNSYDDGTRSDDEAEDQSEQAVDPSIKVTPTRTQSDPLPSQAAERDKADADYHPEVVMLPDSDDNNDNGGGGDEDSEIKFTATLDSGCDDNWISWTKMEENDLGTNKIQALADQPGNLSSEFTDFSGGDVEPAGQVQLRWRASGSGRSEESVFYVIDNENAPFDVLFGRTFMDEHDGGPNFFKKPVLINAGKPLSTAEKARKQAGVRGTSAFAEPEIEDGETTTPAKPVANDAQDQAAAPAPAEQHQAFGKWGKKLAGGFSKLTH